MISFNLILTLVAYFTEIQNYSKLHNPCKLGSFATQFLYAWSNLGDIISLNVPKLQRSVWYSFLIVSVGMNAESLGESWCSGCFYGTAKELSVLCQP